MSLLFAALLLTGFHQVGAIHVVGPHGLDSWGAYDFRDLCTSTPRPGLKQCWQIKIVLADPISGFDPDMWGEWPVEVWGTTEGHMGLKAGEWSVEMISIDETIRQQVSWEAEKMGFKHAGSGIQRIDITVGRNTILITGTKQS